MSTYRERREAKAEKLTEWAAAREAKAAATFKADEHLTSDHAFNFQPGHIPARAALIKRHDRQFESLGKAREMASRAAGIESQLATSIYSDDPGAIEALRARIADLEAKRDAMKARNAEFKKAHAAELKALTPYQRNQAMPHQSYELTNLSSNIARNRKRLEQLLRVAA